VPVLLTLAVIVSSGLAGVATGRARLWWWLAVIVSGVVATLRRERAAGAAAARLVVDELTGRLDADSGRPSSPCRGRVRSAAHDVASADRGLLPAVPAVADGPDHRRPANGACVVVHIDEATAGHTNVFAPTVASVDRVPDPMTAYRRFMRRTWGHRPARRRG